MLCRQEVLQAGGVQALVSVLKRGWSKAAQPAIKTLHMLCQSPAGLCDEASVMQTLAAGGIDGLLDLLKTGPPACQAAAAGALRYNLIRPAIYGTAHLQKSASTADFCFTRGHDSSASVIISGLCNLSAQPRKVKCMLTQQQ